jgi:hypothetical protein
MYEIMSGPFKGQVIEMEHSISKPALKTTIFEGQRVKVKRLISGGTGFILKGGMWARDNYSAGIQSMPTKEDRANFNKPNK